MLLLQDVARLLMLGGALTQMPAWYVELSYAQALEACALLAKQPPTQAMTAFQEGNLPARKCTEQEKRAKCTPLGVITGVSVYRGSPGLRKKQMKSLRCWAS